MANKTINELPNDTSVVATDKFAIQEAGGTTKNVTGQMISDFVESNLPTPPTGDNIYNSNGTLDSDRIVEVEDKSLTFRSVSGVEGAIYVEVPFSLSSASGVEYTSGTIPPGSFRGTPYFNIPIKSTSGSGIDAIFLVVSTTSEPLRIVPFIPPGIPATGSGFEVGDTIILSGADLGGVDGTDDITITVTQLANSKQYQMRVDDTLARIGYGEEIATEGGQITNFGKFDPPTIQVLSYTGEIGGDFTVTQDSTSGSGIGFECDISITIDFTSGETSVNISNIIPGNSGYEVGDTITILGSQIGGTDGVDDLILEVLIVTVDSISLIGNKVETVETGVNIAGENVLTQAQSIIENTNRYELNVQSGDGVDTTFIIDPFEDNLVITATSGVGTTRYNQDSGSIKQLFRDTSENNGSNLELNTDVLLSVLKSGNVSASISLKPSRGTIDYIFGNGNINTFESKGSQALTTNNATPSSIIGFPVNNTKITIFKAKITGTNSNFSKVYFGEIIGIFKSISGVQSQIGTTELLEKTQFTTATSGFNISGGVAVVQVTGEAATDINWTISYERTIQ